ncbi:hypothetical protein OG436_02550 [Streptomyces caniferus]|uniref:hypothetical protein n=1 Tax=Streptomyces caniferus TaxID=285557 RepID=UPI002E2B0473|nr:hypothetical protein [Streptomyces caniferus]
MTPPSRKGPAPGRRSGTLAHEVESYLLVEAERAQARREAEALCAKLPWLTTAQADDLARHYMDQRLGLTCQALQAIADRAKRLRGEYEARYAALRRTLLRRHAACACLLCGVFTATAAVLAHSLRT